MRDFDLAWARGVPAWQWGLCIPLVLALPVLPWLAAWGALRLSRGRDWLRSLLMIIGPLGLALPLVAILAAALLLGCGDEVEYVLRESPVASWLLFELVRCWGAAIPLNPAALPPDLALPTLVVLEPWHIGRTVWLCYPLAVLSTQLLGARLLGKEALAGIHARRQAG